MPLSFEFVDAKWSCTELNWAWTSNGNVFFAGYDTIHWQEYACYTQFRTPNEPFTVDGVSVTWVTTQTSNPGYTDAWLFDRLLPESQVIHTTDFESLDGYIAKGDCGLASGNVPANTTITYTVNTDRIEPNKDYYVYIVRKQAATFYGFCAFKNPITSDEGGEIIPEEPESFTVSYNANGGSGAPAAQTKILNTPLTLSSVRPTHADDVFRFTLTGNGNGGVTKTSNATTTTTYPFLGWSTSVNGSVEYQPGGTYTANQNVTLYAVWDTSTSSSNNTVGSLGTTTRASSANGTYTVTFNGNGGTPAQASTTSSRTNNYSFEGWGTTTTSGVNLASNVAFYSSTIIYAQWDVTETCAPVNLPSASRANTDDVYRFTITGNANGGNSNTSVIATRTATTIYNLVGWDTNAGASTGTTGTYTPTGNTTLYAIWNGVLQNPVYANNTLASLPHPSRSSEGIGTYTITYNGNGGTPDIPSQSVSIAGNYTFSGWGSSATSGVNLPDSTAYYDNATVYAQWSTSSQPGSVTLPGADRDTSTAVYNFVITGLANGGVANTSNTATRYTDTVYTLVGWNTNPDATTGTTGTYTPSGNTILYAIWRGTVQSPTYENNTLGDLPHTNRLDAQIDTYTVTYNANTGTTGVSSQSVPVTGHYTFAGWGSSASSGVNLPNATAYYDNTSVYHQWSVERDPASLELPTAYKDNTQIVRNFTITGNANGGDNNTSMIATETTVTTYAFAGWNTSASASSGMTGQYTPMSNVTLYAIYTPHVQNPTYVNNELSDLPKMSRRNRLDATYTVTFNPNTGIAEPSSATADKITTFEFSNWGSIDGIFIPDTTTFTDTTTVYAQWNENTTTEAVTLPIARKDPTDVISHYAITGDATLGSPTNSITATKTVTTTYVYAGWNSNASAASGMTGTYVPMNDITLYAIYIGTEHNPVYTNNKLGLLIKPTLSVPGNTYNIYLDPAGGIVTPTEVFATTVIQYEFTGWNSDPNGNGIAYTDNTTFTEATTVYATWNKLTEVGSVNLPNPTRSNDVLITTFTITGEGNGGTPTYRNTATKSITTTYTFLGWNANQFATSGTIGKYVPTANVKLYAIWRANEQSPVYTNNKISDLSIPTRAASGAPTITLSFDANGGVVSPEQILVNTNSTYNFSGWNSNPNGTGIMYTQDTSFTEDTIVYAIWTSDEYTASVDLPTPTRPGYIFVGWNPDAYATTGITGSFTPDSSQILYAIWELENGVFHIFDGTEWRLAKAYVYDDNQWKQAKPYEYDASWT